MKPLAPRKPITMEISPSVGRPEGTGYASDIKMFDQKPDQNLEESWEDLSRTQINQ